MAQTYAVRDEKRFLLDGVCQGVREDLREAGVTEADAFRKSSGVQQGLNLQPQRARRNTKAVQDLLLDVPLCPLWLSDFSLFPCKIQIHRYSRQQDQRHYESAFW